METGRSMVLYSSPSLCQMTTFFRSNVNYIAVFKINEFVCHACQCDWVRGNKVFRLLLEQPLTGGFLRSNHSVGFLNASESDGISTSKTLDCLFNGFKKVSFVEAVD